MKNLSKLTDRETLEEPIKLKRAIIKEELVAITKSKTKSGKEVNNIYTAIILNQFIYWSERVKDFDKFIEQENQRLEDNSKIELTCGWIYKTAEELADETMLGLSKSNMREHIQKLVNLGFIEQRTNPNTTWDKTLQYRVNLINIAKALFNAGYNGIDGYRVIFSTNNNNSVPEHRSSDSEHRDSNSEHQKFCFRTAIPYINTNNTINNTTYIHAHDSRNFGNKTKNDRNFMEYTRENVATNEDVSYDEQF